jgi:AraC-like DNA-binding protein
MSKVFREISPLNAYDCFTIFARPKKKFDFPLHSHEEFELNLIWSAKGAKRIVGYHVAEIDNLELVFVGPNLPHGWFTHQCKSEGISEITVQFHRDLFDEKFLSRNQLKNIRSLLERSCQGILFPVETAGIFKPRIEGLTTKRGFSSVLELMSILDDLSVSGNMQVLSNVSAIENKLNYNSRRIEKVFEFMRNNYAQTLTLADVAKIANMPDVSFSRFIKKRTGRTFIESLNEIRLGHASRLLIDTTQTIAEIAYKCGFNNLSYFNRIFKKKNSCTPKDFRENYSGTKVFI